MRGSFVPNCRRSWSSLGPWQLGAHAFAEHDRAAVTALRSRTSGARPAWTAAAARTDRLAPAPHRPRAGGASRTQCCVSTGGPVDSLVDRVSEPRSGPRDGPPPAAGRTHRRNAGHPATPPRRRRAVRGRCWYRRFRRHRLPGSRLRSAFPWVGWALSVLTRSPATARLAVLEPGMGGRRGDTRAARVRPEQVGGGGTRQAGPPAAAVTGSSVRTAGSLRCGTPASPSR